jgi:hypothetical protein
VVRGPTWCRLVDRKLLQLTSSSAARGTGREPSLSYYWQIWGPQLCRSFIILSGAPEVSASRPMLPDLSLPVTCCNNCQLSLHHVTLYVLCMLQLWKVLLSHSGLEGHACCSEKFLIITTSSLESFWILTALWKVSGDYHECFRKYWLLSWCFGKFLVVIMNALESS